MQNSESKHRHLSHGFRPKTIKLWSKTIKVLEDNIGENLIYLGFDDDILDTVTEAWSMKEKSDKSNFINTKNFCSAKDTVKSIKDKPQTGKKYLQDTL